MGDPFRRLFLDQVELIINKEANRETVLSLLQLAQPSLLRLGSRNESDKVYKILLARVHPDKHPQDSSRATWLCQTVQEFYSKGLAVAVSPDKNVNKRKPGASSPNGTVFPQEFNVKDKWDHVDYDIPSAEVDLDLNGMSRSVAYQCINSRGAIVHGKRIENKFNNFCVRAKLGNAEAIFAIFGGVKRLEGVDAIKKELMNSGPVVSTSFTPNAFFLRENTIGKSEQCWQSDILIVGWQQQARGEFWIVQPLYNIGSAQAPVAYVAVGHFGLDDCCLAPMSNLENSTWQPGPYFDHDLSNVEKEWQTWPSMECSVLSMNELDDVFKQIVRVDISSGILKIVTVRNKNKKAHSRTASLESIVWNATECCFKVKFNFI
eukprot:scaffold18066_cov42-Cyclotella_meneghiniana.AAC.1